MAFPLEPPLELGDLSEDEIALGDVQEQQQLYESEVEEEEQEEHDEDFERARSANDHTLKSRFESIFAKYGCDFTGVGDEIDIETGEIVVDNGHLENMQHEADTGQDAGLSSQLMRQFAVNLEHEDDPSNAEPATSFDSSSDDEDEADEAAESILHNGRAAGFSGMDLDVGSSVSPSEVGEAFALDPRLKDVTTASVPSTRSEESDTTGTSLDVLAMPSVQESMLALKSKGSIDPKEIEALGLSIANQIARFMGNGKSKSKQNPKRRKDPIWDYPELPEFKRRRTEPRPKRPQLPQLSAVISPSRRKPHHEPKESLWAPQRHPKPVRPKRKLGQSRKPQDGSPAVPAEVVVTPQVVNEVQGVAENIVLKKCYNCSISATIVWRKGPDGDLCNACGMYYYRYGLLKPLRPATPSDYEPSEDSEAEKEASHYSANTSRRLAAIESGQKHGHFTVEEDALIIKLKELDGMTWEQLARHFRGRSCYAIQCRYSKRLVARPSEGRAALLEQGFEFKSKPENRDLSFLESEDELLLQLRDEEKLEFAEIAEHLPDKSAAEVEARYKVLTGIIPAPPKPARSTEGMPKNAYHRFSAEEDALIVKLREVDKLTWDQVAKRFPVRTGLSLQKRYVRELAHRQELKTNGEPDPFAWVFTEAGKDLGNDLEPVTEVQAATETAGPLSFTEEEDESIRHKRKNEGASFEDIQAHLPGRSVTSIAERYQYLQKTSQQDGVESSRETPLGEIDKPADDVDLFVSHEAAALRIIGGSRISKADAEPPARYRTRYNKAEDSQILKWRNEQDLSWEQIALRMPGRSAHALEVRWHQKLKHEGTFQPDDSDAASNVDSRECTILEDSILADSVDPLDPGLDELDRQHSPSYRPTLSAESEASGHDDQTDVQASASYQPTESAASEVSCRADHTDARTSASYQPTNPAASDSSLQSDQASASMSRVVPSSNSPTDDGSVISHDPFQFERDMPKQGSPYTHEEHDLMVELREQGLQWADISARMPGRTPKALQCYWSATKRKGRQFSVGPRRTETPLLRRALGNDVRRRSEGVVPTMKAFDSALTNSIETSFESFSTSDEDTAPISNNAESGSRVLLPSAFPEVFTVSSNETSRQLCSTNSQGSVETVVEEQSPDSRDDLAIAGSPPAYPATPLRPTHMFGIDATPVAGTSYETPARYGSQSHPYYATQPAEAWLESAPATAEGPNGDDEIKSPQQKADESRKKRAIIMPRRLLDDSDDEIDMEGDPIALPRTSQPPSVSTGSLAGDMPPFSWTDLITMALKSTPGMRMSSPAICQYLEDKFPYFRTCTAPWRNTLRGRLSHCNEFEKTDDGTVVLWGFAEKAPTGVAKKGRPKKRPTSTEPTPVTTDAHAGAASTPDSTSFVASTDMSFHSAAADFVNLTKEASIEPQSPASTLPAADGANSKPPQAASDVQSKPNVARTSSSVSRKPSLATTMLQAPALALDEGSDPLVSDLPDRANVSDGSPALLRERLASVAYQAPNFLDDDSTLVEYDAPDSTKRFHISSDVCREPESSPATLQERLKAQQSKRIVNDEDSSSDFEPDQPPAVPPPKSSSPGFTRMPKRVSTPNVYSKGARPQTQGRTTISELLKQHTPSLYSEAGSDRPSPAKVGRARWNSGVSRSSSISRSGSVVKPTRSLAQLLVADDSEDELAL